MNLIQVLMIYTVFSPFFGVNAEMWMSFVGSREAISCTEEFVLLSGIGFIQCQKLCARLSLCDVLQYRKNQLECRLYESSQCQSSNTGGDLYLKRVEINQLIPVACGRAECTDSSCIRLTSGLLICVLDKVTALLTQVAPVPRPVVGIDGSYFVVSVNRLIPNNEAEIECQSYGGRLAILNSQRKISILSGILSEKGLENANVGAYPSGDGVAKWDTGEDVTTQVITSDTNKKCIWLRVDKILYDSNCADSQDFVCEYM